MGRTKKVGVTGRFGPRYGLSVRREVLKIEEVMRRKHKCPSCGQMALQRKETAIWVCRYCGAKYAGQAYKPPGT